MREKGSIQIIIVAIILLVAGAVFYFLSLGSSKTPSIQQNTQTGTSSSQTSSNYNFSNPKKSAHYESNTPEHAAILAGTPINVVINFNFDLAKPSEIRVYSSGVKNPTTGTTSPIDIAVGEIVIDANKLNMRRALDPKAPDDKYTVEYKACWPDGSCHDGSFEFAIDRTLSSQFVDQTNKKEITINMSEIMFKPQNIKVSKGTKITWVNDENAGHYVNTDPHPGHSYYPAQNSEYLEKSESYSLTFDQAGIYPYHCSSHTSMTGNLLVE